MVVDADNSDVSLVSDQMIAVADLCRPAMRSCSVLVQSRGTGECLEYEVNPRVFDMPVVGAKGVAVKAEHHFE
jgi:hypothetical protein